MSQVGNPTRSTPSNVKYRVGASPLHGIGLFAQVHIKQSTKILSEVPFLAPNPSTPRATYEEFGALPNNQQEEILQRPHAGHLPINGRRSDVSCFEDLKPPPYPTERTTEHMYANDLAMYIPELRRNNADNRVGGTLLAIWYNNCFDIGVKQSGFFLDAALLNHSCAPNCYAAWNTDLEKLTVHATRDINEGEELLICYHADSIILQPRDERQQHLKESFALDCTCHACDKKRPDFEELDDKRVQYAKQKRRLTQRIMSRFTKMPFRSWRSA